MYNEEDVYINKDKLNLSVIAFIWHFTYESIFCGTNL